MVIVPDQERTRRRALTVNPRHDPVPGPEYGGRIHHFKDICAAFPSPARLVIGRNIREQVGKTACPALFARHCGLVLPADGSIPDSSHLPQAEVRMNWP